ncbi:tetratricopeptide repeat protein [Opitutaceae bacterium TAV4]|nr:tetratricopeptide repeat protein [Opitutaceae bacterium TAV4]RRK00186.1 tetratricopeptide repeat protein [Opitutaceae bacterium TAV3]RRK02003.1 tetratricopeptide repeat protein [Opitutaceae bacterium TAV3]
MNSSDTEKERFVLPQWLPFRVAILQRDLLATNIHDTPIDTRASEDAFEAALVSFRELPGPFLASNLLGISLRLGKTEASKELATYVLGQPIAGPVARRIAQETLGEATKPVLTETTTLHTKIREAKTWVRRFPTDAIAWVEYARLYTIIGQKKRAEKTMERALILGPTDRYIIRAAVRFFIHRGNWERAHHIAGAAARETNDPWIIALWISTGSQLDKIPPKFKNYFATALASNNHFHFSELLEACATQEIIAGSEKKAKRAFQQAWLDPSKNVIAHSQWVIREKMPQLAATASIDFSQSSEAMAWVSLMRLQLSEAVQSSREWALEEPFSSKPFMHGSFVDTLREDYEEAESLAREGLRANPGHHGLTNNLAFSLVGQNRIDEAVALLEPLRKDFEETKDVALLATWGLVRMKQRLHAEGRQFYARAIEEAKNQNDSRLALRAALNLFMAEIDTGGTINLDLLMSAAEAVAKTSDARVIATAERLNKRFRTNQSLFPNEKEKAALARFERAVTASSNILNNIVIAAEHLSIKKE